MGTMTCLCNSSLVIMLMYSLDLEFVVSLDDLLDVIDVGRLERGESHLDFHTVLVLLTYLAD